MQRYFVTKIENDQTVIFSQSDSYHMRKVMRMNVGESVEVVIDSVVYICEIISIEDLVTAKIVKTTSENNELDISVYLVQSLVKEQKMDYILQKATELGVSGIYPYQSERSVVKVSGKEQKKMDRWQSITKEASEQSKRNQIPSVFPVLSLKELASLEGFDHKFICTVNEKEKSLKKVLPNVKKSDKMIIVVGPEGGFSQYEETILMESGFIPISLGKSVLRTETAGLFFLSCVRYLDME